MADRATEAGSLATPDRAIVALGNPFRRDDGVAPAVIDRLREQDLPDIALHDLGDGGFTLVHVLLDHRAVVIVDAADIDAEPGEIRVFDPREANSRLEGGGTHDSDVLEVIETADSIGDARTTARIVAVQPADIGYGEGLSPPVESAVPALSRTALETVREL